MSRGECSIVRRAGEAAAGVGRGSWLFEYFRIHFVNKNGQNAGNRPNIHGGTDLKLSN